MEWGLRLKEFVDKYKQELTDLKIEQANVKAKEKNLKGTPSAPTHYALELNAIKESLETLYKQFSHQSDPHITLIFDKEGNPKGVNVVGSTGEVTSIGTSKRETTNYQKMIDEMIIDGIITHEQVNKYKEKNIVVTTSISVK